jgi:hypothetical protein
VEPRSPASGRLTGGGEAGRHGSEVEVVRWEMGRGRRSSAEGGIFLHVCHIDIDPHLSVTHGLTNM